VQVPLCVFNFLRDARPEGDSFFTKSSAKLVGSTHPFPPLVDAPHRTPIAPLNSSTGITATPSPPPRYRPVLFATFFFLRPMTPGKSRHGFHLRRSRLTATFCPLPLPFLPSVPPPSERTVTREHRFLLRPILEGVDLFRKPLWLNERSLAGPLSPSNHSPFFRFFACSIERGSGMPFPLDQFR